MNITKLPEEFFGMECDEVPELNVFDYEVRSSSDKNKMILSKHAISFLMEGEKEVHFSNASVSITPDHALLMQAGNFLMTEHIGNKYFRCLLFFFSPKNIDDFFIKYPHLVAAKRSGGKSTASPYFKLEKDAFIVHFIHSLAHSGHLQASVSQPILRLKFEEIMLYLMDKYKDAFLNYMRSLLQDERKLSFKTIVENNAYTNLSLEEIAFLCSMSLSTFKRQFTEIYQVSPGKWFQRVRLNKAKEILSTRKAKPSEIFMDFGYDSLSNFSAAFKNEFGYSPKEVG